MKEKTYDEIRREFEAKHLSSANSYAELERIHLKWKRIGKLAKANKLTGLKYG